MARGVAIFAMLIIDFQTFFSVCDTFPSWLFRVVEYMDRRAAVVLVIVSGAGLSLMFRRAGIQQNRKPLLKRAVFLLLAGALLVQIWRADILHYYGAFIIIGIFLSRLSSPQLLVAAFAAWLAGLIQMVDPAINCLESLPLLSLSGQVSDLLFTGYYPLFPWAALYIFGMWLGRQNVADPVFQFRLLAAGLGLVVLSECASLFLPGAIGRMSLNVGYSGEQVTGILGVAVRATWIDLSASTPLSVISGLGTGICVVVISFVLSGFAGYSLPACFITAGKNTLSLYVLHILFIRMVEYLPGIREDYPLLPVLGAAVLFFMVYMRLTRWWLKTHPNGPLEWAMRHFPYVNEKWLWPGPAAQKS